jgi:hypothetical protein
MFIGQRTRDLTKRIVILHGPLLGKFLRRVHLSPRSLPISFMNWYDQKPFIGLIGAGQMYDVRAVPSAARKSLEVLLMRSYHHDVGSYVELPTGRARNPLAHIHVGNTESLDVLRPSGKVILQPLKENAIEASRVVMLGAGWRTR